MLNPRALVTIAAFACFVDPTVSHAADLRAVVDALKQGGHVIVFRHGATDNRQMDIYPFKFDDMTAQRQLSDNGRDTARQVGASFKQLGIPVGDVYTSKLNRAVETGRLLAGTEVAAMEELTDSGAGRASAMAGTTGGGNAELGDALRKLASTAPKQNANTIVVTHKTNIIDAFGKEFGEVQEGEAIVFKTEASGRLVPVTRVQATEWNEAAR